MQRYVNFLNYLRRVEKNISHCEPTGIESLVATTVLPGTKKQGVPHEEGHPVVSC